MFENNPLITLIILLFIIILYITFRSMEKIKNCNTSINETLDKIQNQAINQTEKFFINQDNTISFLKCMQNKQNTEATRILVRLFRIHLTRLQPELTPTQINKILNKESTKDIIQKTAQTLKKRAKNSLATH